MSSLFLVTIWKIVSPPLNQMINYWWQKKKNEKTRQISMAKDSRNILSFFRPFSNVFLLRYLNHLNDKTRSTEYTFAHRQAYLPDERNEFFSLLPLLSCRLLFLVLLFCTPSRSISSLPVDRLIFNFFAKAMKSSPRLYVSISCRRSTSLTRTYRPRRWSANCCWWISCKEFIWNWRMIDPSSIFHRTRKERRERKCVDQRQRNQSRWNSCGKQLVEFVWI